MDRLRNLFILCFADVVKNCNFTPGYSFGLWKKCVIAAVVDNEEIGKTAICSGIFLGGQASPVIDPEIWEANPVAPDATDPETGHTYEFKVY